MPRRKARKILLFLVPSAAADAKTGSVLMNWRKLLSRFANQLLRFKWNARLPTLASAGLGAVGDMDNRCWIASAGD
jgi:hypothetical protein